MRKKVLTRLIVCGLTGSILTACGSPSTAATATTSSEAQQTDETTAAAGETETDTQGEDGAVVDINDDGSVNNPEAVSVIEGDLSFWSLFTGGDGEWFGKIADDYNATNPSMPTQVITLVWADYYTKLQTAVATGNGPDMGVSHVSKLYELASTGAIQPLDDYLSQLDIDLSKTYSQSNIDAVTINGQVYAIPLDTHAEVMYYNLDLLEQAGISEDDVRNIKNADDFMSLLKKCKDALPADVSPLALTQKSDDPFRVWYAVYFQKGGTDFVNDGATENTMDETKAKEAMQWVKSLYDDGLVLPAIDDHSALFQSGKAAFEFGGTWVTGIFEKTDGLNFNNAEFPSLFNDSKACWADSHTLILPTNEKRTDEESLEAVKFLYYASDEGGVTWAGSGQIPASSTANQSDAYKDMKGYNVVGELDNAKFAPKAGNYYGGMKTDMINALDGYWTGTTDLDAAYAALSAAIDDNLD